MDRAQSQIEDRENADRAKVEALELKLWDDRESDPEYQGALSRGKWAHFRVFEANEELEDILYRATIQNMDDGGFGRFVCLREFWSADGQRNKKGSIVILGQDDTDLAIRLVKNGVLKVAP